MDATIKNALLSSTNLAPLERARRPENTAPTSAPKPAATGPSFDQLLGDRLEKAGPSANAELKFSAHAKSRLNSRGIELSADDLLKMQEAVSRVSQKGSRESLILTDKAAFVVSVKNNTVITAIDRDSMKENVFTNIDSTVMI